MRHAACLFASLLLVGCADVGPFRGAASLDADAGADPGDADAGADLPPIGEPQLLYQDSGYPAFVTVDDDTVYWSTLGTDIIWRAPKGGGGARDMLARTAEGREMVVADGYLYWLRGFELGGSLQRVSLADKSIDLLMEGIDYGHDFSVHGDHVYLAASGASSSTGSVWRVPRAGGEAVALTSGEQLTAGLATDGDDIYWGTWKEVSRAPIDDLSARQVLTSGQSVVADLNVAGAELVWLDHGNFEPQAKSIRRLAGPSFQILASGFDDVADLLVAGDVVYWTRAGTDANGLIGRYDLRAGTADTWLGGLNRPLGLAKDERFVYWVVQGGDNGDSQGSIWRARYR